MATRGERRLGTTGVRTTKQGRRLPQSELASTLTPYLERDGRTLNIIAQAASVDVGYLWHLQAGTKQRPSRDVLIRLGLALWL